MRGVSFAPPAVAEQRLKLLPTIGLLVVCLASPAGASPLRYTGYDTAAVGQANAEVAWGGGLGVLASNPALLPRIAPDVGVELMFVIPQLQVRLLGRPANADIPLIYYSTDVEQASSSRDRPLPTVELANARRDTHADALTTWLTLGGSTSLGLERFRLALLVALPLPDQVVVTTRYFDEREAVFSNRVHLVRFGEWSPIFAALLGLSFAPIEELSLGISVQATAGAVARTQLYMPSIQAEDYASVQVDMRFAMAARPIVGVQVQPTESLSIGLTWKLWSAVELEVPAEMLLWNYHRSAAEQPDGGLRPKRVTQLHRLVIDYQPMEVTAAIGFRYETWRAQAGITWAQWSQFRDHHASAPEDSARYDTDPVDLDTSRYRFRDTVTAFLGTSWRYLHWSELRAGFRYHPSPVPTQDGRTNYADGELWCIALGNRFDFGVGGTPLHLELGLQLWRVPERTEHKNPANLRDDFPDDSQHVFGGSIPAAAGLQTNNPGFPGYTVGGWLIAISVSLHHEF